jgi:hypothetical protein
MLRIETWVYITKMYDEWNLRILCNHRLEGLNDN